VRRFSETGDGSRARATGMEGQSAKTCYTKTFDLFLRFFSPKQSAEGLRGGGAGRSGVDRGVAGRSGAKRGGAGREQAANWPGLGSAAAGPLRAAPAGAPAGAPCGGAMRRGGGAPPT